MLKYDIISTGSAKGLVGLVNLKMQDGWEPIGGVTMNTDRLFYYQAMVRKEEGI